MRVTGRYCALAPLVLIAVASTSLAEQIEIVSNYPGEFTDISQTGTNLNLGDEDEAEFFTTIGNALLPAGRIVVANNGGIGFDPPDTELPPTNSTLPSQLAFGGGQSVMGYWDDIGNDIGGVFAQELDNALIVQWENRQLETGGRTAFITFQIKIFDASEATNPYFQYIFEEIEPAGGASATIGYQDGGAGFNDELWSFNEPGVVSNGTVLTVIPEPAAALLMLLAGFTLRLRRTRPLAEVVTR